ncbi:MAG: diguanylate cyclase [Mesorhizobium sp.]
MTIPIKTQLIATIGLATVLIGLVGGIAFFIQQALTSSVALTEAKNVAQQLASTIMFKAPDVPAPLVGRPAALQEFVAQQHLRSKRDLVVVDRNKAILADVSGEESYIGTHYTHDQGNEISQVIQDGIPRSFIEVSEDAPEGDKLVVVPLQTASGEVVGAVLLEYTSLLKAAENRVSWVLWLIGLSTAAGILAAGTSAFLLNRRFMKGLSSLTNGIQALARGEMASRIGDTSDDEFGQLATGFNGMAAEIENSRTQLADQKAYLEGIVETAAEGIAVIDAGDNITLANPAATEILGRRRDRIEGQPWRTVIDLFNEAGDRLAAGTSPIEMAIDTGRNHQDEVRLMRPDGSLLPVMASSSAFDSSRGGVVVTLSNISELRRAERAVSERADELATLNLELKRSFDATGRLVKLGELLQACVTFREAFAVVGSVMPDFFPDLSGSVHLTSASRNLVEEMAHWGPIHSSAAQFAPEDCWALRRGQEHVAGYGALTPSCSHIADIAGSGYVCVPLAAQGETLGILHLCRANASTDPGWLDQNRRILRGVADTIALALANLRLRETLRQQSIRDPHTGLFNRRYLEETSARELRRMQQSNQPFTAMMLDVDHFKQFNDTFGHEAGDLVLKRVASALLDHAGEADIASRYGGEEFAVVLPNLSLELGIERAESLRKAVKQLHLSHRGQTLGSVTVSIGIATSPSTPCSWTDIIRAADQALYRAKSEGRDRVVAAANEEG